MSRSESGRGLADLFNRWRRRLVRLSNEPLSQPVPAAQLQPKRNDSATKPVDRSWERVATLNLPDGRLLLFDPWYHDPADTAPDHSYDLALQGPPGAAKLHLQVEQTEAGAIVATVHILWDEPRDVIRRPVGSRKVASLLSAAGFDLIADSDELYTFATPLDDDAIARARSVLEQAGSDAIVNLSRPQIVDEISHGLEENFFVALDDQTDPFLVAFGPGDGDGEYEWSELRRGREIVGFECRLVGPEEED